MSKTKTPTFSDLIPLTTAENIPEDDYHRNRIIYVFVDRVIDACTFQARHVSGYRVLKRKHFRPLDGDDISDRTIGVKLYAITCPTIRAIKKGKEEKYNEPFAREAKQFLEDYILHKVVRIKLLTQNKNNTATCQVETSKEACCFCLCRKPKKDISQELARAGYATLNTKGAIADVYRESLKEIISQAKENRIGMWALDENFLSPEELKKKQKKFKSMRKLASIGSGLGGSSHHSSKDFESQHKRRAGKRPKKPTGDDSKEGEEKQKDSKHMSRSGSALGDRPESEIEEDDDDIEEFAAGSSHGDIDKNGSIHSSRIDANSSHSGKGEYT